jgi:hypothetical protein
MEILTASIKNEEKSLSLVKGGALENKENHIKISYSISNYSKYFPSLFRYRLVGSNNNWSDWSSKSEIYFENLPHGSCIFEASAKIGNLETNNKIKYNFTIAKPWYLKPLSLIIYFFSGVLILIIINILHRNYFKNQREKLLKKKEKESQEKSERQSKVKVRK